MYFRFVDDVIFFAELALWRVTCIPTCMRRKQCLDSNQILLNDKTALWVVHSRQSLLSSIALF